MTLPVFRSVSSVSYASRGSPIAVAKPAGVVDGDIMLAVTAIFRASGASGEEISAPAGWTGLAAETNKAGPGGDVGFRVWWKRAASEGASYNFTQSTGANRSDQIAIVAYSGCVTSGSPIDTVSTNSGIGNVSTALSITTTVADTLLVVAGHNWDIAGASAITGGTERFDDLVTICDAPQVTAGATGNKTYTGGSVPGDPWQSWMIALKPVSGAAPTSKVKVWTGSAWVLKPVKVWSGSAWVTKPLKTWNGSAWI